MKFAKTLLASVVLAASSQAFAAIDRASSDSLNTGGSELVLGVYDFTTQTTYFLDTNVAFNDIYTLADGSSWDFSADLASLSSDFEWQVVAADGVEDLNRDNAVEEQGRRAFYTTDEPTFQYGGTEGTTTLANMGQRVDLAIGGGSIVGWQGKFGALAAGDGSLSTYGVQEFALLEQGVEIVTVGNPPRQSVIARSTGTTTTHVGSFEFLANNTLVYSALDNGGDPSEVPLPAAAWLLLSGLAGLGGVARRRRA